MNNSTTPTPPVYPAISPDFILALKVVIGPICILSILGAGLIILTYVAFRDLRTIARQLLANLSIADTIVAASHFVGLFHFQRYIEYENSQGNENSTVPSTDTLCTVQGAFNMFGTVSSFLWTMALALYMFVIIVLKNPEAARKLVFVFYPLCWGIPLVLTVWFGCAGYFGFEESGDIGWCYTRRHREMSITILTQVVGYEVWAYLAFIVLPVLYIATFCHVKLKLERVDGHHSLSMHTRARTVDLKLIFVPLIFLLLRIWSAIIDIPVFYLPHDRREEFTQTDANAALVFLAGVGNSTQGLANAILFCAFTKQVRQKLYKTFIAHCMCRSLQTHQRLDSEEEPTTHFENSFRLTGQLESPVKPLVNFGLAGGKSYKSIAIASEE